MRKRDLIKLLIQGGHYLRPWKRPAGSRCYRVYDRNHNPIANVGVRMVKSMERNLDPKTKLWKVSGDGKLTPNFRTVRMLHGSTLLKKSYKQANKNSAA